MTPLIPLVGLLAAAVVVVPANAAAESPDEPATDSVAETSVLAGVGFAGGDTTTGVALSLLATHRFEWLELGAEGQGVAFASSMLGVGGVGGLHWGDNVSLRILGSAGLHVYDNIGRGLLFSSDPGVSGRSPYVGGRLLLGKSLARRAGGRHRGFLGALVALDKDLKHTTKTSTWTETGWLSSESSERTEKHAIGQTTVGVFFVAGVDLDLTGY